MFLRLGVVSVLMSFGFAASAHVTVDQMTCAQAQHYAVAHGGYYKDAGPDGAIHIYPVSTLEKVNCVGKNSVAPQWESTLDNPQCILSWYCKSF